MGRGQATLALPVTEFSESHGLPTLQVPYGVKDLSQPPFAGPLEDFARNSWDAAVVVSFGYRIPLPVISAFPMVALNMHPSALPRHRGAAPIPHTILAGDTRTAVSIIELHPTRMDAGRLLAQEWQGIEEGMGCKELTDKLAQSGARLVLDTLAHLEARKAGGWVQEEGGATRAPKLKPEQGKVSWGEHGVAQLVRMSRAFEGSIDVHTGMVKEKGEGGGDSPPLRVKLLALTAPEASVLSDVDEAMGGKDGGVDTLSAIHPGMLVLHARSRTLLAKCQGGWVGVGRVQVEGRKVVSGSDFALGMRVKGGGVITLKGVKLV
jgi:methionyl-tRNA formyltransferase